MFDALFGNATEVNPQQLQAQLQPVLVPNEQIVSAFKLVRDMFVFTNKRLILVDRQGMTGNKVEYMSIPYKSIRLFSVETAGTFDRDAELKLWLTNSELPTLKKEIKRGVDIIGLQRTLAQFVLS
jgi:hypothetical protein